MLRESNKNAFFRFYTDSFFKIKYVLRKQNHKAKRKCFLCIICDIETFLNENRQ